MRLRAYLRQQDESETSFAKRIGISQSAMNSICRGGGTNVDTALLIVQATGGLVGFADLTRTLPGRRSKAPRQRPSA